MSSTTNASKRSSRQPKATLDKIETVITTPPTITTSSVDVELHEPKNTVISKTKKIATKEHIEDIQDVQLTVEVPSVETSTDITGIISDEDVSYSKFEDVIRVIFELDKKLVQIQRERSQLTKILAKFYAQADKQIKKKTKSDSSKSSKRAQSGFNKPAHVPVEFCDYLSIDHGIELPRTTVTKLLYDKIKQQGLLKPEDKRIILPDQKLKDLFRLEDGDTLIFSNFQKYVSRVYKGDIDIELDADEDIQLDDEIVDGEEYSE